MDGKPSGGVYFTSPLVSLAAVNVNSDTNPELVSSFNLKSIPYAVAFVDGNAVAQFMGAQPESYVRAFLDRLIPNPGALEHRSAREALAQGQLAILRGLAGGEYTQRALGLAAEGEPTTARAST